MSEPDGLSARLRAHAAKTDLTCHGCGEFGCMFPSPCSCGCHRTEPLLLAAADALDAQTAALQEAARRLENLGSPE